MIVIPVFAVHTWDGGERHNFAYYLAQEGHDFESLKAQMKDDCIVPQNLTVFQNLYEVKTNTQRELRKRVWAKLTPLERDALGMKEEPKW